MADKKRRFWGPERFREEEPKKFGEEQENRDQYPPTVKRLPNRLTEREPKIRPQKPSRNTPENRLLDSPEFPELEPKEDDTVENEREPENVTEDEGEMIITKLSDEELSFTIQDYYERDWTVKDIFTMFRDDGFRDDYGDDISIQRITGFFAGFRKKRIKPRSERNIKVEPQQPPSHDI